MADTEPTPSARQDSDFEHEVMAQCVDAWHDGGSAAVERVLAAHPSLADRLRERLHKLERAGLLGPSEDAAAEIPAQLGEFKLLKRLGSGGMGVVFLAEQVTLGRTVALKLVRPEQRFFPGARARFRREVEAVARLGDAGIVPIYSVGQDQGVDFFAMEYVRGASLGDVIAALHATPPNELAGRDFAVVAATRGELPVPTQLPEVFAGTWVQACCRIVARMARAAQHAHERGVVHRDLKPNNTMVTPDGRVLLLDFGLAAAAGSSRITRSGAMLGTLHYMAPEQLRDGECDARTDVYALGVTLHELLSLHAPFTADSHEALRHQILHGECLPLRQHNPEVPRDVQTCVAVAMDRDPARRYATAQAFADDLERFLQHRPIQARPIGWRLRLVRWGQRHPAWGTAAVLTLLAAAATPFLVQWTRGRADAQIASAKAEAHANLTSAIVAIEGILTSTRSQAMVRTPGLDGERLRQMQDAVRLMERLRRENADDPAVQKLYVTGMVRVADLRRSTGDFTGALAALDDAAPLLAGLRAAEPDALRHAVSHAGWCLSRGSALGELGRMDEATRCWQEVIATYGDRPAAELPPDLLLALASCHNNLGKVASSEGDLERAIVQLQQSVAYEDRMPAGRLTLDREIDRVRTQMNLGTMFRGQGKVGPAREQYGAVQRRVAELAVAHPGDPEVRRETARVEFGLANLAADEKDHTRSLPMRERCLAAMQQLVRDFPERVPYRQELAGMAHETSAERQIAGDLPGAEAAARMSIEVMQPLLQKAPDNLEYLSQLAVFHRQLSGCLWHQRQVEAARQELRQAVTMLESLVGKAPDDLHYRLQMAALWQELGLYHWNEERWEDARAVWRQAADCYEFVLGKGSALPREPRRYPKLLSVLTQAELMCDDFAGVVRVLARLQELQPMPRARLQQLGGDLHVADRADFQELLKVAPAADGPTRK